MKFVSTTKKTTSFLIIRKENRCVNLFGKRVENMILNCFYFCNQDDYEKFNKLKYKNKIQYHKNGKNETHMWLTYILFFCFCCCSCYCCCFPLLLFIRWHIDELYD